MIGPLTVDDLAEIIPIEQQSYPLPWSEDMFRREFGNTLGMQLAWRDEGRLLGYIFAWLIFEDLHINNIAVAPEARGRGLGTALLQAAMDAARAQGGQRVSLEVRPSNAAANRLYEKFGLKQIHSRPGYYYDTGEDAIILAAKL